MEIDQRKDLQYAADVILLRRARVQTDIERRKDALLKRAREAHREGNDAKAAALCAQVHLMHNDFYNNRGSHD